MTIQTRRLILRAMTPEQLREACGDLYGTLASMGLHIQPLEPEELRRRLQIYALKHELMLMAPESWLFCTSWQMVLSGKGTVAGELGFKGTPTNGELEIGYGTEPRFRNRGYMKEAVGALCEYGMTLPCVTSIVAYTGHVNFASQNVLAACGFSLIEKEGKYLKFRLDTLPDYHMILP